MKYRLIKNSTVFVKPQWRPYYEQLSTKEVILDTEDPCVVITSINPLDPNAKGVGVLHYKYYNIPEYRLSEMEKPIIDKNGWVIEEWQVSLNDLEIVI